MSSYFSRNPFVNTITSRYYWICVFSHTRGINKDPVETSTVNLEINVNFRPLNPFSLRDTFGKCLTLFIDYHQPSLQIIRQLKFQKIGYRAPDQNAGVKFTFEGHQTDLLNRVGHLPLFVLCTDDMQPFVLHSPTRIMEQA